MKTSMKERAVEIVRSYLVKEVEADGAEHSKIFDLTQAVLGAVHSPFTAWSLIRVVYE